MVIPVTSVILLPSSKDSFITQKVLGRNQIKYLGSLKIKKFRRTHRQFLVEGDKIVRDLIRTKQAVIRLLIAEPAWLSENRIVSSPYIQEIMEAELTDIRRISSLETPPPAIALLDMPEVSYKDEEIFTSVSIALDAIQDPGNLGTIIRTADWFGIRNIFCNEACADCYNPKVVQASMGAILHVGIHYVDLAEFLAGFSGKPDFTVYGTYMDGIPVTSVTPAKQGIIVFGNESRGISAEISPFIVQRLTIPPGTTEQGRVESLNVSSAVAIVCNAFMGIKTT
ncbi:MAG: RNA methyltransferase [Bacteroidales bacterium]|nr:RNA methyltransferase [Bacteroidales bacterium]